MLILLREKYEEVVIVVGDERISLIVSDVKGDKVKLGFNASKKVMIHRREVMDQVDQRNSENHHIDPARRPDQHSARTGGKVGAANA